jgi:hypothetical protein
MNCVQRPYFKATVVFDHKLEEFSDVSITSIAMKRPRRAVSDA